ncbi:hypothetical protein QE400_000518 [Xanthomonas sacchari]|uniref:helix-turn-helix transcriptional regulator n=1 Tax=Xanthomonas sacchari TaxID=56458 RepID=UPI00278A66BA|nr:hypothetical protein [Xanthomonas sacchari]MDQ1091105.1 hypothetical protein [Xanthomonas sacchari]
MDRHEPLWRLLEPLYDSLYDSGQLVEFSQRLATATDSHIAAVMTHDAGGNGGRLDLLLGADPDFVRRYEQEIASENVWMQHGDAVLRTGAVCDSDTVVPRGLLRRTRYYQDYLRLSEIEQSVALCAYRDRDTVVVATMSRSGRLPPYSVQDMALFRQVAPHWVNVYALHRRLAETEARAQSLDAMLDRLSSAAFLLEADGRVIHGNAAAHRLQAEGALQCRGGALACRDQTNGQQLRTLLLRCANPASADGRPCQGLLRHADGTAALALSAHRLPSARQRARVLLFVSDLQPATDLRSRLRQLFQLTPAEATLAQALYVYADLNDAAQRCGITAATARTRMKAIYAKTGEAGQVALMRLLAGLAHAFEKEGARTMPTIAHENRGK